MKGQEKKGKVFKLDEGEIGLVIDSLAKDEDVGLAERVNLGNAKLNMLVDLQNSLQGKTRVEPVEEADEEEDDEDYEPEPKKKVKSKQNIKKRPKPSQRFEEEEDYDPEYDDGDFGGAV